MQSVATRSIAGDREVALRNSIYEGVFANMFATLTGGVFLTGFALYIGMDEFMIGLLAAMPFLVTVFQLPISYIMEKNGRRKDFWYWGAAVARSTWVPVVIVALMPISSVSAKYVALLLLIFLSYSFNSISGVSWLSLMSDLVPDRIRGRFFGNRNMLCGAAGMSAMLAFGRVLDYFKEHVRDGLSLGFSIIFLSAVFFGMVSLRYLTRVSDPGLSRAVDRRSFLKDLSVPLEDVNFRKFLAFAFLWSFSVYFASPFFTVYFLQDLKFSYGLVATLGTISGFADLIGMRLWGRISDKVRNKAVIRFSSWVAIFIPLAWVFVRPDSLIVPILLNLISGVFWAGINLCMSNLLLGISPRENRSLFLSTYNILGGLGAAAGPILAGCLLRPMTGWEISFLPFELAPIQIVFLLSTMFRLLSFQLFKYIKEPREVEVGQMVRILRSVRGLNVASGFNFLLHPFVETVRKSLR